MEGKTEFLGLPAFSRSPTAFADIAQTTDRWDPVRLDKVHFTNFTEISYERIKLATTDVKCVKP